jgi:nicotinamidase-related amidase
MSTALLLVDAQRNMLEGPASVPGAAALRPALEDLLTRARTSGTVVVHIQNDGTPGEPDEPETHGWELIFEPTGDELLIRKAEPNAFGSNSQLAQILRQQDVDRVVVVGMQSEFCVRETSLGALREGFLVSLPRGAHGTYGSTPSEADALAVSVEGELQAEGVEVIELTDVVL